VPARPYGRIKVVHICGFRRNVVVGPRDWTLLACLTDCLCESTR
jgi:hypothetical protein